jgi:hypothetical protein
MRTSLRLPIRWNALGARYARAPAVWIVGALISPWLALGCSRKAFPPEEQSEYEASAPRPTSQRGEPRLDPRLDPKGQPFFAATAGEPFHRYLAPYFGPILRTAGESSLLLDGPPSPTQKVYRLVWVRARNDRGPKVVRFELDASGPRMRFVRLRSSLPVDGGAVIENMARKLTASEWEKLDASLSGAAFWSLPTLENLDEMGLDGEDWLVEGLTGGRVHLVHRWSPGSETARRGLTAFVAACGVALELSAQVPTIDAPRDR